MGQVQFYTNDVKFTLKERGRLREFLVQLFKKEGRPLANINYIFVSDNFLLNMNKEVLNHNYYTDIITFCLSGSKEPVQAEAYISVDRVRDNAFIYNTTINRELHRVIFHGALHLCGYKDKKGSDKKIMKAMEEKYLNQYFD